jgi:hypothetical protein
MAMIIYADGERRKAPLSHAADGRRGPGPSLALGMVADCSTAASPTTAGTGTQAAATRTPLPGCGTTRTAAGVSVKIEIVHGPVVCWAALAVERDYARALTSGKVRGNGGARW